MFKTRSNIANQQILNGTHAFIGGDLQRKAQKLLVENGTHHFLSGDIQRRCIKEGKHPFSIKVVCPHCYKIGSQAIMNRWHFDRCKVLYTS